MNELDARAAIETELIKSKSRVLGYEVPSGTN